MPRRPIEPRAQLRVLQLFTSRALPHSTHTHSTSPSKKGAVRGPLWSFKNTSQAT
jgi:hypothetical protein